MSGELSRGRKRKKDLPGQSDTSGKTGADDADDSLQSDGSAEKTRGNIKYDGDESARLEQEHQERGEEKAGKRSTSGQFAPLSLDLETKISSAEHKSLKQMRTSTRSYSSPKFVPPAAKRRTGSAGIYDNKKRSFSRASLVKLKCARNLEIEEKWPRTRPPRPRTRTRTA
jgi:hypothetical protein